MRFLNRLFLALGLLVCLASCGGESALLLNGRLHHHHPSIGDDSGDIYGQRPDWLDDRKLLVSKLDHFTIQFRAAWGSVLSLEPDDCALYNVLFGFARNCRCCRLEAG